MNIDIRKRIWYNTQSGYFKCNSKISFRGVAKVVSRQFRVLETVGSSPAASTIKIRLSLKGSLIFIFRDSNQGSPTARKYSRMPSPSQVCGSAYSLFSSGASAKTVINCFMLRLPAASTKKIRLSLRGSLVLFLRDSLPKGLSDGSQA